MDNLTNKQRHKIVAERSEGLCEICHSPQGVEHHHIIGGRGKRNQCETVHSIIALCFECHRGTYGVHGKFGNELDIKLKQDLQEHYFKQGKSEKEVRVLMGGRIY